MHEQDAATSLICRLVNSAVGAFADNKPNAITLKALSGGRSEARVFKLTPIFDTGTRVKGLPVVVKIAPRALGATEKANYENFVRFALPAACRPELLGFVRTRAHAGLCYSLVGGAGGSRPDTLTAYLKRGDATKVAFVLRRIFDPLRDTWYSPSQCRAENDIARRYRDRYFSRGRSTSDNEETLRACAARYFNARDKDGRYVIGRLSFPSPHATLFASSAKRAYRSTVLHGDLNSDNILIATDPPNAMIIDFEKTGRGHVYEDLMHVEASVRINYPRDTALGAVLGRERQIALGHQPARDDPYSASIRQVREAAMRYFGRIEDRANYHFAVAAIALRLMQAADLTHIARARITASALWAAKILADEI